MPRRLQILALVVALSGCASLPSAPAVVKVLVPVAKPCVALERIPELPHLQAWDVWNSTTNEWKRAVALRMDREILIQYVATVVEVLVACVEEVHGNNSKGPSSINVYEWSKGEVGGH